MNKLPPDQPNSTRRKETMPQMENMTKRPMTPQVRKFLVFSVLPSAVERMNLDTPIAKTSNAITPRSGIAKRPIPRNLSTMSAKVFISVLASTTYTIDGAFDSGGQHLRA
jgi:hypothetical protein